MKKILSVPMLLVLLMLCGCTDRQENTATHFLLDTVVTLTASGDADTLDGAFELCARYERLLSRTVEESDVYRINHSDGPVEVSDETAYLISRGLYYGDLSDGLFDITICPVSELWDFNNQIVPDRDEIAAALRSVDYHSVTVDDRLVGTGAETRLDLGGIAKGYIADRLVEYFEDAGVKSGIINLGGNVAVFGGRERRVRIRQPFTDEYAADLLVTDKSVVTAGTYERYIESDGRRYHHILDPRTGYGVESDLASATVIGDSSLDCDALSTTCILLGETKARLLIESIPGVEAVFIRTDGVLSHTDGLISEDGELKLK